MIKKERKSMSADHLTNQPTKN